MATNPRIPPHERKQPQLVPPADRPRTQRSGSGATGVCIGIVVAAVLLGSLMYFFARAPQKSPASAAGAVPGQPVPEELQLAGMQLIDGDSSGSFYLDGHITNKGGHAVTGIVAEVKLRDRQNRFVLDVRRPLEGMTLQSHSLVPDPFTKDPIKPNETRSFRLLVDQVPNAWNNNLPEVQIVEVTAQGW